MRRKRWIVAASWVAGFLVATSAGGALNTNDPIAFTGHGAMFDRQGNLIEVTPEFIEQVQQMYLYALSSLATEPQRTRFAAEQARLFGGQAWDPQSRLIATTALVDWLLEEVDPSRKLSDLRSKNRLIEWYLQSRLFEPAKGKPFSPPDKLTRLLAAGRPSVVPMAGSTPAKREAYIAECMACKVPIPPAWGPANVGAGKWVSQGMLEEKYNFLFTPGTKSVEIFTYTSADPPGICYALPRAEGPNAADKIKLLGIICLGKTSSKACFWDNQKDGVGFDIAKDENVELKKFEGGPGLKDGSGGVCTACHAGENSFVIHPQTPLANPPREDRFSDAWYRPLVHPSWPQNEGPSTLLNAVIPDPSDSTSVAVAGQGCLSCHRQGRTGGRFPLISAHITADDDAQPPAPEKGYCMIVRKSTKPTALGYPNTYTMPQGDPEGTYPGHTAALLAQCDKKIAIPRFTINGDTPKGCGFAYTFCPPPNEIKADGAISSQSDPTVKYFWGKCKTGGPFTACTDAYVEATTEANVPNYNFMMLAVGTYRIGLRLNGSPDTMLYDVSIQPAEACATPTALSLVSAEFREGAVDLVWSAPGAGEFTATVQRQREASGWSDLATVTSDDDGRIRFSDTDVAPGARYGYRLAVEEDGSRVFRGETRVDVPTASGFALAAPRPTPASGAVTVSFSLPIAGRARLEVLDIAGRVLSKRTLESLGPGWHDVEATEARALPAGVYFVRLTRLGGATGVAQDSRMTRLLVVR